MTSRCPDRAAINNGNLVVRVGGESSPAPGRWWIKIRMGYYYRRPDGSRRIWLRIDRLNSSNHNMNLEQAILSQSKKVDRALETLRANRKYQQDKLTLGLVPVCRRY